MSARRGGDSGKECQYHSHHIPPVVRPAIAGFGLLRPHLRLTRRIVNNNAGGIDPLATRPPAG
jgi:hypothetical protein